MTSAWVLPYQIRFVSDWHVGTGAGRSGDVDRLVTRDRSGFPFVPAKTVTGLWRDASERLAWALDGGTAGPWARFVDELWGSQPSAGDRRPQAPRAALVSVRPAHHRQEWRDCVCALANGHVPAEVTVVRWSTAIDADSGRAKDATLRSVELGRALSELQGSLALSVDQEANDIVVSFLKLAAAGLTAIGGHRRRGLGECTVVLDQAADAVDVQRLRAVGDAPPRLTPARPTVKSATAPRPTSDVSWMRVRIGLETLLPVVVPDHVEGNVVLSRDHPTGRQLLPAVCQIVDRTGLDAAALVQQHALLVSNAWPVVDGRHTLPMPFAFSREKDPGQRTPTVFNTLRGYPPVQAKQLRGGWVVPATDGGRLRQERVRMSSTTHSTILDAKQRPDESIGGVFTYQAIAPQQRFAFDVMLRVEAAQAGVVAELFDGLEHAIGTSRKDDFGLVRFRSLDAPEPLAGRGGSPRVWQTGDTITVWCVSDVLLDDELLGVRPDAERLCSTIAAALGVDQSALVVDQKQVRLRVRRHDGWHGRWQAPQPSLVAVQAGSVMVLEVTRPISSDQVDAIAVLGIGERRAEGFGRVLIDPPLLEADTFEWAPGDEVPHRESSASDRTGPLTDAERQLLAVIEWDMWRGRVEGRIDDHREQLAKQLGIANVGRTQLNRLRQLLLDGDVQRAVDWLDRQRERKRWPDKAATAMLALISEPQNLWTQLGFEATDNPPQRMGPSALVAVLERLVRVRTRRGQGSSDGAH